MVTNHSLTLELSNKLEIPLIMPDGLPADSVSIQTHNPQGSTFNSGVITVRKSNMKTGTPVDINSTPVTITAPGVKELLLADFAKADLLTLRVTTAASSATMLDIAVSLKRFGFNPENSTTVADQVFSAYDNTGTTDISSGYTDIPWDTEVRKDTNYTHSASSASITVAGAGDYLISYDVTVSATSTACTSGAKVLKNGSEIDGFATFVNHGVSGSKGTMSASRVVTLAAGDVLKVQASRLNGAATTTTQADGSRITILQLRS